MATADSVDRIDKQLAAAVGGRNIKRAHLARRQQDLVAVQADIARYAEYEACYGREIDRLIDLRITAEMAESVAELIVD